MKGEVAVSGPIEKVGRRRPQRERWWRFRRQVWKWVFRGAMVSSIATPWLIYWLTVRK